MTGRPASGLGRLTRRPQFVAAASGRRFHTERMTVQARSRTPDERTGPGLRIGITVTKRVGHATERNRIRRRLREAVDRALGAHDPVDLDLVLVARRDALGAPFSDLVGDLQRAARSLTRPKRGKDGAPAPAPAPSAS